MPETPPLARRLAAEALGTLVLVLLGVGAAVTSGGDLVATAPDLSRGYMEVRGIGIINVANLYGLASIRPDKRLDMVVTLKPYADLNEVDRLGVQPKKYEILGQAVSHVEIPVAPGRDTARMVAIAALDLQLRKLGYNMADEFNQRLLDRMAGGNPLA